MPRGHKKILRKKISELSDAFDLSQPELEFANFRLRRCRKREAERLRENGFLDIHYQYPKTDRAHYRQKKIMLDHESTLWVLYHEFAHYLQHKWDFPFCEETAERVAKILFKKDFTKDEVQNEVRKALEWANENHPEDCNHPFCNSASN